jgi:hypothetical protein
MVEGGPNGDRVGEEPASSRRNELSSSSNDCSIDERINKKGFNITE